MLTTSLLIAALTCTQVATSQATTPTRDALEQVVVIGASMSGGFGLSLELETQVDLAHVLSLALGKSPGDIEGLGDCLFSRSPVAIGSRQVDAALKLNPSLVLAPDFAFWFGYGLELDCEARLKQLDTCLKQLERFKCPVLVGDIPDMTCALQGRSPLTGGRAMITAQQIPAPGCQAKLNQRLAEWAEERRSIAVWPMSEFVIALQSKETVRVRGNAYTPERKQGLLQADLLHPSSRGAVAVSLLILDRVQDAGWIDANDATWDARLVHERLMKSTQAHRDKAAEIKRRREDRRKQRAQGTPADGNDTLQLQPPKWFGRWSA